MSNFNTLKSNIIRKNIDINIKESKTKNVETKSVKIEERLVKKPKNLNNNGM